MNFVMVQHPGGISIRAEVIHWDELLSLGSLAEARAQGKLRLEGKEYTLEDGEVMQVRFAV